MWRIGYPKPLVFRLYPVANSALFVRVLVWRTREDMLDYCQRMEIATGSRCQGTCTSWTRRKYTIDRRDKHVRARGRLSPMFAEVCLWRGRLGSYVTTHEFFHAAIAWGRRVKFDFRRLDAADSVNQDEERIAYVASALNAAWVAKAYPAGLYDANGDVTAKRRHDKGK